MAVRSNTNPTLGAAFPQRRPFEWKTLPIVREIVTCVTGATQIISVSLNCGTFGGWILPVSIDHHLGARITEARERLGLCQMDVAHETDIPAQQLAAFEQGIVRIPADAIARLSRALDVTPGWFYTGLPGQDAFDRTG